MAWITSTLSGRDWEAGSAGHHSLDARSRIVVPAILVVRHMDRSNLFRHWQQALEAQGSRHGTRNAPRSDLSHTENLG